ncbi:MFS transporter [Tsukamurella pseudospumae]|uniref:Major facilitator superfamily (MFS) profile domain-containing protein n=1 Tax=Tsukamurella pseudospumae TaxID=239498 RepID=A0A138AX45_9ACTN|nr:MFS transporter [Tsukamurella pseudospumae]KXP14936.1 hypothetical protein AXK60_03445 [Tsukamurella pseudospumae]
MTTTATVAPSRSVLLRTGVIAAAGALPIVGQLYVVLPLTAEIRGLSGHTNSTAALSSTVFALVYAAGILALGPLADRFGARRLMVASAGATAAITLLAAFAPSAPWFLLGRAAQGLAAAAFTPATLAYIARTAPSSARVPLNTAAIGAGLASAVVGQVVAQLIAPLAGITGVFVVFAVAAAVAAVAARTLLPSDTAPADDRPSAGAVHRAIPGLLMRPRLVLLYCTGLTFLSALVALYTALGADGRWPSATLLILRASSLPAVVVAGLITLRLSAAPPRARILAAVGIAVTGALLCATAQTLTVGIGLFAVIGAIALAAPSVVAEVTRLGAPAIGAAASLYTVAIFGGASLGAPLAAALGNGLGTVALGSAAVLALGGLTSAIATRT